jgi:aspartate aminotransferase
MDAAPCGHRQRIHNPQQPFWRGYSRSELAALAEVLRRHPAVYVLADEIYENCLFTDEPYTSFASLDDEMFVRTETGNGVPKTYGNSGSGSPRVPPIS